MVSAQIRKVNLYPTERSGPSTGNCLDTGRVRGYLEKYMQGSEHLFETTLISGALDKFSCEIWLRQAGE